MAGDSADSFNIDGHADDGTLLEFTTSETIEVYTKTPSNVKGDYLEVHHPNVRAPPNLKKRRRSARLNDDTKDSASVEPAQKRHSVAGTSSSTTPKKTRKRDLNKKINPQKNIPRCIDECDPADATLIEMRDAGEDWPAIRAKLEEMTGWPSAHSTLPNRYARLKSNLTQLREADNGRLVVAKQQVETSFEEQKWELVANAVRNNGGEMYPGVVLKRQYKKLMLGQGVVPPPGVRDADFEGEDVVDIVGDGKDENGE